MVPELERIEQYRLASDLTWAALSAEMRRANLPVAPNTLHRHVKRAPDAGLNDRTLYKIRTFLARVGRRRRRSRGR